MPPKLVLAHSIGRRADAPPPTLQCSWTNDGRDAAWVRLTGELDMATAHGLTGCCASLACTLASSSSTCATSRSFDSSGVHAIVDASIRLRRAGRRILLLRGRQGVDRVFTLTGTAQDVGNGDIHAVEPSVHAPRRSSRKRLRNE